MSSFFSTSELNGINLVNKDMKRILSVGISTNGNAEIEMINKGKNVIITATTIDEEGIEKTKKLIKEKGLENKIILKLEDIREKNIYEDNYFDYIYARLVLHYLTDQELKEVLKEFKRILKDKGLLYIVVRSDKCDECHNILSYDENTGMTKHISYTGPILDRRFHSIDSISKVLREVNFNIKSIKDYDEVLYKDYERTIEVTARNNLIEVICQK